MITVEALNYHIGKVQILSDINLTIPDNQLTALIGPNGAGKSTLLSLIARLTPIQSGKITLDNLDIASTDTRELAKHIAIFQQHYHLMSRLKVDELLTMARFPYHRGWPKPEDREICNNTIETFNLSNIRQRFLDSLSGGQRQRVLCAMVFAQNTPTILLDEPLNNLDMYHARDLMQTLRHAVDEQGKNIILILHDINYAARYADHIIALADGKLQFCGNTATVLTAENISRLFQTQVSMITDDEHCTLCNYY